MLDPVSFFRVFIYVMVKCLGSDVKAIEVSFGVVTRGPHWPKHQSFALADSTGAPFQGPGVPSTK